MQNLCTFAIQKTYIYIVNMAEYLADTKKKITARTFIEMKAKGEKITMLTAYDYTMATLLDRAGVDSILIGDSASNVMAGNATTLPITVDEMIVYGRNVARAVKHALVVCDMPFGSYQACATDGIRNAVRIMKETGADAVKLEGGEEIIDTVRGIVRAGIPVCGHLGLTPQSVNQFGGYGLRAKEEAEAEKLVHDAHLLEEAGCFAIVLEKIPARLTSRVCAELRIPVIGIGGGAADGQVLVGQDMLGMNQGFRPKFLRQYADVAGVVTDAVKRYVDDVRTGGFPNEQESY